MKVYTLIDVWGFLDNRAEGMCIGVYATPKKVRKAMAKAVEEAKESWVECNRVIDEDDIEIVKSDESCTLATDTDIETFEIQVLEMEES